MAWDNSHPAHRTRQHRHVFSLSDEEETIFQTRLQSSGLCLREFICRMIIYGYVVPVDKLNTALQELNYQGKNLNQIAKAINTRVKGGDNVMLSPAADEELSKIRTTNENMAKKLYTVFEKMFPE